MPTHYLESRSTVTQRRLRQYIINKLGGRCMSPDCSWHNSDGTVGCTDPRALQIDHIYGGGSKSKGSKGYGIGYYYKMKKEIDQSLTSITTNSYQLLCANCNWIKRYHNQEATGYNQHKDKTIGKKRIINNPLIVKSPFTKPFPLWGPDWRGPLY